MVITKQLSRTPGVPLLLVPGGIRSAGDKGLLHKHIEGIDAALCSVRFQAFTEFPALCLRDKMQDAAAEDDVVLRVGAIVEKIRLEKFRIDLIVLGKPSCFLDPLFGYVKCSHGVTAFCEKNGIFSLAAPHIQHTVGLDRREQLHDIIADAVGREPPVVLFWIIPSVVVRHDALVAEQCVDGRVPGGSQSWQHL